MPGASRYFHRASSAQPFQLEDEGARPPQGWPVEWSTVYTKDYPRCPMVELPAPTLPPVTLADALAARASSRSRTGRRLGIGQVASILGGAMGLRPDSDGPSLSRRRYPSGGARFPTEAYVAVSDCDGLDPGLYHYNVVHHGLRLLRPRPDLASLKRVIFGFEWVVGSQALIILSAALWRSSTKYGERAYRYALLEAGHAMQNICLVATALGVPHTPLGGFADAALWDLLDSGDDEEVPLYVAVIP